MAFVIGIDEAGYGPNLGPLAIGGTLWQVPDAGADMYQLLHPGFLRPLDGSRSRNMPQDGVCGPIEVGDSKLLYSSGGSLEKLERPVLSLFEATHSVPANAVDLICQLALMPVERLLAHPGYDWSDLKWPISTDRTVVGNTVRVVTRQLNQSRVRCLQLAASLIFPEVWNRGLDEFGNKANLLSVMSCRLVSRLLRSIPGDPLDTEPVIIYCDKHGGRNHYAAIVQQEITPEFVTVRYESREVSQYAWRKENGRSHEISFSTGGENRLPVALASMIAKYLRELSMRAWNGFWKTRLPDIIPTAGYPVDARRFHRDILETQTSLKIPASAIWRSR